jgi:hypothetical protein
MQIRFRSFPLPFLRAAVLASALMVSGCLVQSDVQGRYVEDQSDCRDSAEGNIGRYEKPGITDKDRNAQLVTLFADCMAKSGWQVARPKRKPSSPTTDGPHGPLDPYPSTAATATTATTTTTGPAAQPQTNGYRQPATQAPVGQRPVQTTTTVLSPSGSMPPLSQPVQNAPSRYQPGRSYIAPDVNYGTGLGRNF